MDWYFGLLINQRCTLICLNHYLIKEPFNDLDSLVKSDYMCASLQKYLRNFSSPCKCIRITFIHRLYTGPKDSWGFEVLSSPAYKKVMENNVKLDLTFNVYDISREKTLTEPKSAMFDWLNNDPCQVKFEQEMAS